MKKILCVLLAILITCSVVGCSTGSTNDSYSGNSSGSSKISKQEAIEIAKNSTKVKEAIASFYGLKFYAEPDYGTVTAEKDTYLTEECWEVTLKGTISGYKDDYKTEAVYRKSFSKKVYISLTGEILQA